MTRLVDKPRKPAIVRCKCSWPLLLDGGRVNWSRPEEIRGILRIQWNKQIIDLRRFWQEGQNDHITQFKKAIRGTEPISDFVSEIYLADPSFANDDGFVNTVGDRPKLEFSKGFVKNHWQLSEPRMWKNL